MIVRMAVGLGRLPQASQTMILRPHQGFGRRGWLVLFCSWILTCFRRLQSIPYDARTLEMKNGCVNQPFHSQLSVGRACSATLIGTVSRARAVG